MTTTEAARREIEELCVRAGHPERARNYLALHLSAEEVQVELARADTRRAAKPEMRPRQDVYRERAEILALARDGGPPTRERAA